MARAIDAMKKSSNATYNVTFALEDETWLAQVTEIPEVHTFGATLGKAREYIVDALALWLDVPISTIKDSVVFAPEELPNEIRNLIHHARSARELADSAAIVAPKMMGEAAFALVREAHLSMRDAGELLGISHQRVQQLLAGGTELAPTTAGSAKVTGDLARTLREFLPGGSKEDIGALAAVLAAVALFAWSELNE